MTRLREPIPGLGAYFPAGDAGPIILFDGECVLCSANAQFVLKRDRRAHFRLAAMQGETGARLCRVLGLDPHNPTSIVVLERDRVRRDSDAVLAICEGLDAPWRWLGALRRLPASLRDPVYLWIARRRYLLFGKRAECWVAPPEYRRRLL